MSFKRLYHSLIIVSSSTMFEFHVYTHMDTVQTLLSKKKGGGKGLILTKMVLKKMHFLTCWREPLTHNS